MIGCARRTGVSRGHLRRAVGVAVLALLPSCALPFGSQKLPPAAAGAEIAPDPHPLPQHPADLKFPDSPLALPIPQRIQVGQGLLLLLLPAEREARVLLRARVDAGARRDPDGREGLAHLTAHALVAGALHTASGATLAGRVEERGGTVQVECDHDAARFTLDLPAADAELGVEWLADLLQRPHFDERSIAAHRNLIREESLREVEDDARLARTRFDALVHCNHPYGHLIRSNSADGPTAAECAGFHHEHYRPATTLIGIAGGVTAAAARAAVERFFGAWSPSDAGPHTPVPDPPLPPSRAVTGIERPLDLCRLVVGHAGLPASHPDWIPLQVLNQILAADPVTSRLPRRLGSDVRSARETRSRISRTALAGTFAVETACLPQDAPAALTAILGELRRLQREPVSDQELAAAQATLRNSYAFRFDSQIEVMEEYLALEALGLPADYLSGYRDRVLRVTPEEVRRVALQHLHPDSAAVLAIGPTDRFLRALAPFGPPERRTEFLTPVPDPTPIR